MNTATLSEILTLPIQERIYLVELIWDSITALPDTIEISPEVKADLESRLAHFKANPEAGYSWADVKSHLKKGSWRTI